MHNDWKGVVATIVVIIIMFAVVEFKDRSK
ncbi:hypothetical protein A5798_002666 [Enterococcus sp. 6C8_DIV0013]|nr:hypothetical protein A5798_002666 [Enterococcus sp. 6C8_DIV0013]